MKKQADNDAAGWGQGVERRKETTGGSIVFPLPRYQSRIVARYDPLRHERSFRRNGGRNGPGFARFFIHRSQIVTLPRPSSPRREKKREKRLLKRSGRVNQFVTLVADDFISIAARNYPQSVPTDSLEISIPFVCVWGEGIDLVKTCLLFGSLVRICQ